MPRSNLRFVPKSRGRKPKKSSTRASSRVRSVAAVASDPRRGTYDVGTLGQTDDAIMGLLLSDRAAPELMVELLLPLLWISGMRGAAANRCVDACMTLHYAYEQLGIIAQPRPVDLVASDNRTGQKTLYGRPDPFWEDDHFNGHCVLWLPGSRRTVCRRRHQRRPGPGPQRGVPPGGDQPRLLGFRAASHGRGGAADPRHPVPPAARAA